MIISSGKALGFAPQALGETTPTFSNGYFYGNTGLSLLGRFATYAALYRGQPSIATVIDKIANAAARLTVKVWDTTPATGKVEDTTSGYAKLLANPCPTMSPFNFWRWTVSTYEVYGEAFWYKQRDSSGETVALLPMHPSRTAVKRDEEGKITYVFTVGVASAGILYASEEDVVVFQRYNPESLMRGLSRLEPLRTTLLNEDSARRAMQSWWKRGARPSVVLKHPSELSQAAQDRLRASFDARHAGADNMGGTNVLEEGLDLQVIQLNAEEMQYIESRKLNLQEVCMVYDVPPPVVHILDHATFSNITEQMRSMYRDTMSPRLEDIESVVDHSLRAEFFPTGGRSASFALDEVLRGDFETRADAVIKLVSNGVMKPSEARPLFDLPDAGKVADKLFANAALVELGTKPPPAAPPIPALEAAPVDEVKAVTVRAVMGKLARVKGNKSAIREKLVEAHSLEIGKLFDAQRDAVKASLTSKAPTGFDPKDWDTKLAAILLALSKATTQAVGSETADALSGEYDPARLEEWLTNEAATSAANINQSTAEQLAARFESAEESEEDPEDSIDGVFDGRRDQIATSRVAMLAGLSSLVAAEQNDARSKTWVTTAANPRPSHAAMDGETVGLNETFSNGMQGPGDMSGGADEVAGCSCDLQFSKEG